MLVFQNNETAAMLVSQENPHDFFLSLFFLLFWSIQNGNWKYETTLFTYLFLFIYFSERAESNEKFFSRNQEFILSASLVGFCLIVIVGVMLYLFKRRVLLRPNSWVRLPYTVSVISNVTDNQEAV